jgi:hypothetical protein
MMREIANGLLAWAITRLCALIAAMSAMAANFQRAPFA